jgi:hypothetical protein
LVAASPWQWQWFLLLLLLLLPLLLLLQDVLRPAPVQHDHYRPLWWPLRLSWTTPATCEQQQQQQLHVSSSSSSSYV